MPKPAPSLSVAAARLLPDAGTSPKCADHSADLQVDPGGTAIAAGIVVLIETPLPWPKPVFAHDLLRGANDTRMTAVGAVRVLAAVPHSDDTVGRVHTWWRDGAAVHQAVLQVHSNDDVLELMDELTRVTPDQSRFVTSATGPARAALICTQGSHDICCGTAGTRFALDVAADDTLADHVTVFRVSHTGGHRFAPTAMTLPDGRMWAHLTVDDLRAIVHETGDAAALAPKCRGWWGAERGPAQMAERAIFTHLGWAANTVERRVEELADGHFAVHVESDDPDRSGTWNVHVEVHREVPTITCRALGGMPAKTSREYAVTDASAVT